MDIVSIPREYTEDGVKYIFRDVTDENGNKRIQHLVKEPWGEEFWNDNEPADNEVLGARPYDQTEHQLERVKTRVQDKPAPVEPAEEHEDDKTERKAASPRKAHAKKA